MTLVRKLSNRMALFYFCSLTRMIVDPFQCIWTKQIKICEYIFSTHVIYTINVNGIQPHFIQSTIQYWWPTKTKIREFMTLRHRPNS